MAPEEPYFKRKAKENQFPFDLGVKGRKTGLVLPELGERDEHGLEPMDHLFSSPEKPSRTNLMNKQNDATLSEEEDMELGESTTLGPVEVLAERQRSKARIPPPRSKSPIKTFLNSPARRNAALEPNASPVRGSVVESITSSKSTSRPSNVQRKLEFSKSATETRKFKLPNKRPFNLNSSSSKPLPGKPTDRRQLLRLSTPEDMSDEEVDDVMFVNRVKSQQTDARPEDEEIQSFENESDKSSENESQTHRSIAMGRETVLDKSPKSRKLEKDLDQTNRPVTKSNEVNESSQQSKFNRKTEKAGKSKQKGARSKKPALHEESEVEERPHKKSRNSQVDTSSTSNGIVKKKSKSTKSKAQTRKKESVIEEAHVIPAQPGPPLPRGKGLLILRRETAQDSNGILRTRYGRNSIKPLAFWSNEKIEFEEGELPTKDLNADFVGRKIKHVIRAEEIVPTVKKDRGKTRNSKPKNPKRNLETESDDEIESWEVDPGRIIAEVRKWDPNDELGTNIEERPEEIALSSAAIVTRDIANASFRFAKTLTLPFFGAGMVDLPPGSEKKQKNSRKMQMVFFVFYGKVQVTVNDNVFRISKGGMWQVPRGNFYGIQNDYDKPARIFFSQGCEIEEDAGES